LEKLLNKFFKDSKRNGRLVLIFLSLILLYLGFNAVQLRFDYDFEKFFPQENEDLIFYQDFREEFENDNDFILISVEHDGSILDPQFLQKLSVFSDSLRNLPHIRELISPLDMKKLTFGKGMALPMQQYYLNEEGEYSEKELATLKDPTEPIFPFLKFEENAVLMILKNVQMISKQKSDELAGELEILVDQQSFQRVHLMGKILGQQSYIEVLQREFFTFMIFSILIVVAFLWIAYRSFWGIAIPLLTVLLAIVGSLGIMQLSGSYLNMMTTLLPVIMLVVGMSDVIHLISKYLEELRRGRSKTEALKWMIRKVGTATLLTSLTTALGFITLIGVKMKPVQSFGIFTAVGVVLAFFLSIFFISAIFILIPRPKISLKQVNRTSWEVRLANLFTLLLKHRKLTLICYGAITIISLIGASRIKFDYFLMQDLSEDHPLMIESKYFQQFGGVRPFEMAVMPKGSRKLTDHEVMLEIEKIAHYLADTFQVNQLISPVYPIQYLNKSLRNDRDAFFKIPASEKRYNYLLDQVENSGLNEQLEQLIDSSMKMGRITGRVVDPGSLAMLERQARLDRFMEDHIDLEILDYRLTGTPVIIDKGGRQISKTILWGLLTAFALIAISMGLLFRSLRIALISLVPNIFPLLLTAGFIGFAGIDLNMTTSIVFTIAFGIAVDDTIHFLSRYRQELKLGRTNFFAVRRTFISTGKAITLTSLILLGGFVGLLFSDFLSTFYIGLFVSMTLVFALVTDLSLLPILLLKKTKP